MRILFLKATLLTFLLLILVGCPGSQQRVQTSLSSENLTMTCIHQTLDTMEDIVKVWIFYDQTPIYRAQSLVNESSVDGVGFAGNEFIGQVLFQGSAGSERSHGDIYIYTKDLYWGFRDKSKFVAQIERVKASIRDALIERCN